MSCCFSYCSAGLLLLWVFELLDQHDHTFHHEHQDDQDQMKVLTRRCSAALTLAPCEACEGQPVISREIQKTVTDKSNVKVNRWWAEKSKPAFHHCHENHHQYHLHHHACHHFHHRHHHHYVCHSADIIRQCPEMILVYSAFSITINGFIHFQWRDWVIPAFQIKWTPSQSSLGQLTIIMSEIWKHLHHTYICGASNMKSRVAKCQIFYTQKTPLCTSCEHLKCYRWARRCTRVRGTMLLSSQWWWCRWHSSSSLFIFMNGTFIIF